MRDALLVFSRYPRLGKVKTRLLSILTPVDCLQLHHALLLDTLDRTADLDIDRYLFLADCSDDEMHQFSHKYDLSEAIHLHHQRGKDLGERMWNAYQEVSKTSARVVFLGSDTPSLPLSHIEEAQAKLAYFRVVIGPVEDGGYYLLALSEPRIELFQDIDWGTACVLEQTLTKLAADEYFLLPHWYDVDTASDLRRLEQELKKEFTGFPERTYQLLRSRRGQSVKFQFRGF